MWIRFLLLVNLLAAVFAESTVEGPLTYEIDKKLHEGFLALPEKKSGYLPPTVFIVHEWMGLNDYNRSRARQLASLGYAALALDIYGIDQRPSTREEAQKLSGYYKQNPTILIHKMQAGMDTLLKMKVSDPDRVAAIGYCFGGTAVLELARSGARLSGVVSIHGGLKTPTKAEALQIQTPILVLHGGSDPFVPDSEVADFFTEMKQAKAKWQFISYGEAVHSFSNPNAGSDPGKGSAYNRAADKQSFLDLSQFLRRVLK